MSTPKFSSRTPKQLLELIHARFPDITWQAYRLITEGWDHEVLILDDRLVFRFPNDEEYLGLLKNEVRLLGELKPLVSVAIPDYTYVSPDGQFAGYPFIPGRQLTKPVFDSLKAEEHALIAKQLAGLLTTLHTLIAKGHDVSYVPGWDFGEEQAETRELAAKHLPGILTAEDYKLVEQILSRVDDLVARPLPRVFTHSDIYSNHLFWDAAKQRLGIIDFSDMSRSDPAFDFGELYEYGADFVNEVYKYYDGPKDDTFLARAWIYQQWAGVNMMTDHFVVHKTDFATARQTFDRIKRSLNSRH